VHGIRKEALFMSISAIGQDSHRFEAEGSSKPLLLGGVSIPGCVGLRGNSDADVVLHAITNAISGLHGTPVLGTMTDDLCVKEGITDSRIYLAKSLDLLVAHELTHLSISIEAARPHLASHIRRIRESIAGLLALPIGHVAVTATSGEGLTAFGRGEGIQAFAIMTAEGKGQARRGRSRRGGADISKGEP
jgi:2-C-methyl-D-erythritol 2,4-cyclodiphosphate synthase